MKVVLKKLNELSPMKDNVRKHSEKQIQEYIRSLNMFGQIRPAVIDEKNVIICGNGMCEALKRMGKDEVECVVYDSLTDAQKKKLMLADNKIYELGATDLSTFDELIREIGDFDVPGFDENLLRLIADSAQEADEALGDYGKDNKPLEETQERRMPSEFGETARQLDGASPYKPVSENKEAGVAQVDSGDERPYVVCPNCGEKIWL